MLWWDTIGGIPGVTAIVALWLDLVLCVVWSLVLPSHSLHVPGFWRD